METKKNKLLTWMPRPECRSLCVWVGPLEPYPYVIVFSIIAFVVNIQCGILLLSLDIIQYVFLLLLLSLFNYHFKFCHGLH